MLTFWSVSPNVFLTSLSGVEPRSKKVKMPHTCKVATDKGKAKSTDHASPESSSIGNKARTERESANHTTASDSTGGETESEPSTSRGPSEATVASGAVRDPSGSEKDQSTMDEKSAGNTTTEQAAGHLVKITCLAMYRATMLTVRLVKITRVTMSQATMTTHRTMKHSEGRVALQSAASF